MRHNEESIQNGIAMFKRACFDATKNKDVNGVTWWSGSSCAGGGASIRHRMNEDSMTLHCVALELGHTMNRRAWLQGIKDLEARLETKYKVK